MDTAERVAIRAYVAKHAKEMVKVWMVRDPTPKEVGMSGPKANNLVYEMTIPRLVDYLNKIGLSRWKLEKGSLHDDESSALQDAKERISRFENRFRLQMASDKVVQRLVGRFQAPG